MSSRIFEHVIFRTEFRRALKHTQVPKNPKRRAITRSERQRKSPRLKAGLETILVRKTPYRREILLGNVATRSAAADEVKPLPLS